MTWGTTQFVGGAGVGLVARRTLAIVDTTDVGLKETLWRSVARDAPLDEVLDQLVSHGLRSLPSFALIQFERDDVVRVIVRGEAMVRLQTASATREVRANGVRSWVEDVAESVEQVEVVLDDKPQDGLFHVLAGAVPASKLVRQARLEDQHAVLADEGWTPTAHTGDGPDRIEPLAAPPSSPSGDTRPADTTLSAANFESVGPDDVTPLLGRHDGRTISRAEYDAIRAAERNPGAPASGPNVRALLCEGGHPNPPTARNCRTCGVLVSGASVVIAPRPALGVLRLSNGVVVTVDRPQLLGRKPKLHGELGSEVPSLVRIDSPAQGVSRLHAAIHLEGWQVLIEDLGSANGTVVTLPGGTPQRLSASEPMLLVPGAVAVLGGEVSLIFEALP